MTPERQSEIKEIIENVRKFGRVSHEVLKAMDEMMLTIDGFILISKKKWICCRCDVELAGYKPPRYCPECAGCDEFAEIEENT